MSKRLLVKIVILIEEQRITKPNRKWAPFIRPNRKPVPSIRLNRKLASSIRPNRNLACKRIRGVSTQTSLKSLRYFFETFQLKFYKV